MQDIGLDRNLNSGPQEHRGLYFNAELSNHTSIILTMYHKIPVPGYPSAIIYETAIQSHVYPATGCRIL